MLQDATQLNPGAESADTAFDWENCWYPVTFFEDLSRDKPTGFALYDEPLVLYRTLGPTLPHVSGKIMVCGHTQRGRCCFVRNPLPVVMGLVYQRYDAAAVAAGPCRSTPRLHPYRD
jgi:hypothetical protein